MILTKLYLGAARGAAPAILWLVLATAISSLVSGCQSLPVQWDGRSPPLLAPAAAGFSVTVNQLLTIDDGDSRHQMLAVLQISPAEVRLTGLTAMGQRLLSLKHNGQQLEFNLAEGGELPVSPEWLLAQLQLVHWPFGELAAAYEGAWQLERAGNTRLLGVGGRKMITVTYSPIEPKPGARAAGTAEKPVMPVVGDQVSIENHQLGLILTLKTLKVQSSEDRGQ